MPSTRLTSAGTHDEGPPGIADVDHLEAGFAVGYVRPVAVDRDSPGVSRRVAHPDGDRIRRIGLELEDGFSALRHVEPAVSFFGSARSRPGAAEYDLAREVASAVARQGFNVITGGGPGVMEAANLGAERAGGRSVGLNISLPLEQDPNPYQCQELSFEFHYFFIRKFWFVYLAKALIVFPGGFGTLDELFELLTLIQTRKSRKVMPVVLYGTEYWDRVLNFESMIEWDTIARSDNELFKTYDDVDEALEYLKEQISSHYLGNTSRGGSAR